MNWVKGTYMWSDHLQALHKREVHFHIHFELHTEKISNVSIQSAQLYAQYSR